MSEFVRAFFTPGRRLLLLGLAALALSVIVQRQVEKRRVEANLVWTDPENKQTLEAGMMALGGFRGILADVLWVRAITQQEAGRYYELKMICDTIQQLQPTFTNIHAYQARNMTYNLAAKSETCEDKWYWIRSGIEVLERGLERNKRNYALWHELGFTYMDRLSDVKLHDSATGQDCSELIHGELPALDDLSDIEREKVFTHPELWKDKRVHRAARDENIRFAAYYFFRALETKNDPSPLIDERNYGNCIFILGHYRSRVDIPPEQRKWNEWGAEEWWVEIMRRNVARGVPNEGTVRMHLHDTLIQEMGVCDMKIAAARTAHRSAALLDLELLDDYRRFQKLCPEDKRPLPLILEEFRSVRERR